MVSPTSKEAPSAEDRLLRSIPKELTALQLHLSTHPAVQSYAPSLPQLLADMAHRHVGDLLQDALLYAEHAGKTDPDLPSLRLASQARLRHAWVEPHPGEFQAELAREVNARPLPKVEERIGGGVRLPPEADCLGGRTFVLVPEGDGVANHAAQEARNKTSRAEGMQVEREINQMLSTSTHH